MTCGLAHTRPELHNASGAGVSPTRSTSLLVAYLPRPATPPAAMWPRRPDRGPFSPVTAGRRQRSVRLLSRSVPPAYQGSGLRVLVCAEFRKSAVGADVAAAVLVARCAQAAHGEAACSCGERRVKARKRGCGRSDDGFTARRCRATAAEVGSAIVERLKRAAWLVGTHACWSVFESHSSATW